MNAEKTPAEADALHTPSIPDFDTIERFLARVDGAPGVQRGFNFIRESIKTKGRTKGDERFCTAADLRKELGALQASGCAGFFFVNKSAAKGTAIDDITGLNAWIADCDYKAAGDKTYPETGIIPFTLDELLTELPLKPHIVVFTGNGYHLYFLAAPDSPIESRRLIQTRIAAHLERFGADASSLHLLRLPGTFNRKGNGWRPVTVAYELDARRYTLEQMEAAFAPVPNEEKQTRRRGRQGAKQIDASSWQIGTGGMDYARRRAQAEAMMQRKALGIKPGTGQRNKATKELASALRFKGLSWADARAIMLDWCGRIEWHDNIGEADSLLSWAYNNLLPEHRKEPRQGRWRKLATMPHTEAADKLGHYLGRLLVQRPGGLHVAKVTVGTGKTQTVIDLLAAMHHTPGYWPTYERKGAIHRRRIVYCVDTHEQAAEVQARLSKAGLDAPIYKGRNAENCEEYHHVASMHRASKYCRELCAVYQAGLCQYQMAKAAAKESHILIATKAAMFNNLGLLSAYHVVIVDEDLSSYLYHQITVDGATLQRARQGIDKAGLKPRHARDLHKFLDELAARATQQDKAIRLKAPPIPEALQATDLEIERGASGTWEQAPLFWHVLALPHRIRARNGKLTITARRTDVIERVRGDGNEQTYINLDATPLLERLSVCNPSVESLDVTQQIRVWQDMQYAGRRRKYHEPESKTRAWALGQCQAILEQIPAAVTVCFKDQDQYFRKALGPDATLAIWGRDTRALDKYKGRPAIILAGYFTPNIDASHDIDKVLGLKGRQLKRSIQNQQDAEIEQAIGRLRAVHMQADAPADVFVLSNLPLKLQQKARPITDWFEANKADHSVSDVKPSGNAALSRLEPEPSIYIQTRKAHEAGQNPEPCGFQPEHGVFQNIQRLVSDCIARFGFFAHDLIDGGRGDGQLLAEAAPGMPEPLALGDVSSRAYKRHIASVLAALGKPERLQVSPGHWVKIWGDKARAEQYITKPEELQAARATVQAAYAASPVDLVLCLQGLQLGHIDAVDQLKSGAALTSDNWAVLVHRHITARTPQEASGPPAGTNTLTG